MTRIVIAGAGTIGCYVGGLLALAGHEVTLYGRSRVIGEIRHHGLTLTEFSGETRRVSPGQLLLSEDPSSLSRGEIVLVCVTSAATVGIAREIAAHAQADAIVVSLQNGLESVLELAKALPEHDVRAGMVGFNIVAEGYGVFHRAVSGSVRIETGPGNIAGQLVAPGLHVGESDDIYGEQWGKLLINLVNAPNALSGLSLRNLLLNRDWRRFIADQMGEALAVLKAAKITPKLPIPLPPWMMPYALRLPTSIFSRVAKPMITIDPEASSSMARDLERGRKTEISAFQEAITALGEVYNVPTPINAHVVQLVHEAEAHGEGRPNLSPADLRPTR